jgi:hypothetical protein
MVINTNKINYNFKHDFAIGDDKPVIPTKKKKPELPMRNKR